MRFLHPYDPAPKVFMTIVLEKYISGNITNHAQAENFFLSLLLENIQAVGQGGAGLPHSYTDTLQVRDQATYKPLSYDKPDASIPGTGSPSFEVRFQALGMGKRKEGAPGAQGSGNKKKQTGNKGWFPQFNLPTGCPNPTTTIGHQREPGCMGPDG